MGLPENQAAVSDHQAQSDAVKTATGVAAVAEIAAEAVVPGVTSSAPVSSAEATTLGIEEMAGRVLSAIPGVAQLSGIFLPAEVVTHLAFAFVNLFRHHVATVNAQKK